MVCPICKQQLSENVVFCPQCGFELHILPEKYSDAILIYENERIESYSIKWNAEQDRIRKAITESETIRIQNIKEINEISKKNKKNEDELIKLQSKVSKQELIINLLIKYIFKDIYSKPDFFNKCFNNLSISDIEHPFESQVCKVLKTEKYLDSINDSDSLLEITEENFPRVYYVSNQVSKILNIKNAPIIYINLDSNKEVYMKGDVCSSRIVLGAKIVELCDENELMFIIAREFAYILTNRVELHSNYNAVLWNNMDDNLKLWGIASALTADRVGYLCCLKSESACKAIIKTCESIDISKIRLEDKIKELYNKYKNLTYDDLTKVIKNVSSQYITAVRLVELIKWKNNELKYVIDKLN